MKLKFVTTIKLNETVWCGDNITGFIARVTSIKPNEVTIEDINSGLAIVCDLLEDAPFSTIATTINYGISFLQEMPKDNWVPLTKGTVKLGGQVKTNKKVKYPLTGRITELDDRSKQIRIVGTELRRSIEGNREERISDTVYPTWRGRYRWIEAQIYTLAELTPFKHARFKCVKCGKRKAKFTKGLCINCNSLAI